MKKSLLVLSAALAISTSVFAEDSSTTGGDSTGTSGGTLSQAECSLEISKCVSNNPIDMAQQTACIDALKQAHAECANAEMPASGS